MAVAARRRPAVRWRAASARPLAPGRGTNGRPRATRCAFARRGAARHAFAAPRVLARFESGLGYGHDRGHGSSSIASRPAVRARSRASDASQEPPAPLARPPRPANPARAAAARLLGMLLNEGMPVNAHQRHHSPRGQLRGQRIVASFACSLHALRDRWRVHRLRSNRERPTLLILMTCLLWPAITVSALPVTSITCAFGRSRARQLHARRRCPVSSLRVRAAMGAAIGSSDWWSDLR